MAYLLERLKLYDLFNDDKKNEQKIIYLKPSGYTKVIKTTCLPPQCQNSVFIKCLPKTYRQSKN